MMSSLAVPGYIGILSKFTVGLIEVSWHEWILGYPPISIVVVAVRCPYKDEPSQYGGMYTYLKAGNSGIASM